MEYLDLSVYTYYAFPLEMRNIGWLGSTHGLQRANTRPSREADLELLRAASGRVANRMLGWHECHWCGHGDALAGNGEYHYYAHDGEVYAAPRMILHYVEAHGYRPPEVFLESLKVTGGLAWDRRAERIAGVLADESEDLEFRCLAISEPFLS